MFIHVEEVNYTNSYKLCLKFNDGKIKEVDLQSELYGEIFEPLKNINYFKKVYVNENTKTTEWPNGADFAPEFLYEIGIEVKTSA